VTIREILTRRSAAGTEVIVTLALGQRSGRGTALALPTTSGLWSALAKATVAAFLRLTEVDARIGFERVRVDRRDPCPSATVLLTSWTGSRGDRSTGAVRSDGRAARTGGRGEERLLGVALLRDDPCRAVVRATLDALNRRATVSEPPLLVV
jgi:hypothetical protein